jgi:membrane-bound lytic murein transglycosylase B
MNFMALCRMTLTVVCLLLAILTRFSFSSDPLGEGAFSRQPLMDRLLQDGFDFEFLSNILLDSRATLVPDFMMVRFDSGEAPELYSQFLTPDAILVAKGFLQQNLKTLREMEKRFHVQKEVAVAILLVESRFGENIGKFRVIPTLASRALMDTPANVQNNHSILHAMDPEMSYEWVERVTKRRANWGYHELKCFLQIVRQEPLDPLEIRGSHAGAVGMAQFIPSSYLAYAVVSDGFEKWLLSGEDAIFSIGNYLKAHGWDRDLSMDKKKRVLWQYNRSQPYIEAVLEVAKRLKGGRPRSSRKPGKGPSN